MKTYHVKLLLFVAVCGMTLGCSAIRAADTPVVESPFDALLENILSVTQGWGELGINTAVRSTNQPPVTLRIKDKEYTHGLGHHAVGEIVVDLGGQFQTFQAEIGIQWQGGNTSASVIFQIYADDKKVFDSGVVHENDPPRPVTVSVKGAEVLRLVASDAGDGISYDCANWADAQLIRDPAAKERPAMAIDMAPFAIVASWDPKVTTGTKAGRVEEFPAEDVVPYQELLPAADGTYPVPVQDGAGCIGLQWDENRLLRQVILRFSDKAPLLPAESIQLQFWSGTSAWQGQWQVLELTPKKVDYNLVWSFGYQQMASGTQKVRWVFSETSQPIVLTGISAFTRSRCETVGIRIESTQPNSQGKVEIDPYNGYVFDRRSDVSPHHRTWDTSKPLTLNVLYNVPEPLKVDRTVLRFRLPDTAFGVAIEDLLANDCVYVPHADLFVTRLPAPITAADYLKNIAGQQTVLEQVRSQPDQDFARAWSAVHNPVQNLGPTMISLANDNRKYIVGREGAIFFDLHDRPDDPRGARPGTIYQMSYSLPWTCSPVFGSGKDLPITRHLEGGWLPIPVTTTTDGPVEYRQVTYVIPLSDPLPDVPFWYREFAMCVADYQAKNTGNAPVPVKIVLGFGNPPDKPIQFQNVKEGLLVIQGDRIAALIDTRPAAPLTVKQEGASVIIAGDLPAGATARHFVSLPAWKVDPKACASLLVDESTEARVKAYWTSLLEPAMQIEIPDPFLSNIIRASQVHCLMASRNENRGTMISPWVSGAQYGPLESESNPIIRGLDMTGHTDYARRALEFMLSFCNQQGFITTGYTVVGTGQTLWTLAEYYQRSHDRAWLQQVAPEVVRICQWIARQREKTKRLDARGLKVPEYGLMTPGVSADWDRYAYRLFNDAHYYAALESCGRILADIDDPAAPAIQQEARQYRQDILRAFQTAQARTPVVKLQNCTWVPAEPSLLYYYGDLQDYFPNEDAGRASGYTVELSSNHLVAVGALDPASRETDWMLDHLEDVHFLRDGWGDYPEAKKRTDIFSLGGFACVQPYYGRFAEIYALRDEVKPYIRTYFNTVSAHAGSENLTFWEHFANRGMWNKTHETGWFLCQTRIMLVNESGDELWLAPFVPKHWLQDGQKVAIRNAPTRFGPVSYTITSSIAAGRIDAVVQLPENCSAGKIVLRLRHPDGKPMQSVTIQGQSHPDFNPQNETITFAPVEPTLTICAKY